MVVWTNPIKSRPLNLNRQMSQTPKYCSSEKVMNARSWQNITYWLFQLQSCCQTLVSKAESPSLYKGPDQSHVPSKITCLWSMKMNSMTPAFYCRGSGGLSTNNINSERKFYIQICRIKKGLQCSSLVSVFSSLFILLLAF